MAVGVGVGVDVGPAASPAGDPQAVTTRPDTANAAATANSRSTGSIRFNPGINRTSG